MGCGCGGESNVYKVPDSPGAAAQAQPAAGLPKVWNGPKPKLTTAK